MVIAKRVPREADPPLPQTSRVQAVAREAHAVPRRLRDGSEVTVHTVPAWLPLPGSPNIAEWHNGFHVMLDTEELVTVIKHWLGDGDTSPCSDCSSNELIPSLLKGDC